MDPVLASTHRLEDIMQLALSRIEEKNYTSPPEFDDDPLFGDLFLISASLTYNYLKHELNIDLDSHCMESRENRFKTIVNGMRLFLMNHDSQLEYWELLTYFDEPTTVTKEDPHHDENIYHEDEANPHCDNAVNCVTLDVEPNTPADNQIEQLVPPEELNNVEDHNIDPYPGVMIRPSKQPVLYEKHRRERNRKFVRCSNINSLTEEVLDALECAENSSVIIYSNYAKKIVFNNIRKLIPTKVWLDKRTMNRDIDKILSKVTICNTYRNLKFSGSKILVYGHLTHIERQIFGIFEETSDKFLTSILCDFNKQHDSGGNPKRSVSSRKELNI